MNIFRLLGDMSHTASILFLLLKLRASKSAAGEEAAHALFNLAKALLVVVGGVAAVSCSSRMRCILV